MHVCLSFLYKEWFPRYRQFFEICHISAWRLDHWKHFWKLHISSLSTPLREVGELVNGIILAVWTLLTLVRTTNWY